MSTVQYPIEEIPRDPDPASKIDIGALTAWWAQQDQDGADLVDLINHVKATWPDTLPTDSWYIAIVGTHQQSG
jgi:hypothetical protein